MEGFEVPFLVHWNVSLPEIMNYKRFDYSVRQNIADPGSISMRNVFPLIPVLPKPPQLPDGTKKQVFGPIFGFSQIFSNSLLGSAPPVMCGRPQMCPSFRLDSQLLYTQHGVHKNLSVWLGFYRPWINRGWLGWSSWCLGWSSQWVRMMAHGSRHEPWAVSHEPWTMSHHPNHPRH